MTLYDYTTGAYIRELTDDEAERYNKESDNGTCGGGTGAVDGEPYGHDGSVYAN